MASAGTEELVEQSQKVHHMDLGVRHGFIRKVYAILTVQLLVTAAVGYAVMIYAPQMSDGMLMQLMWGSFCTSLGVLCIFLCVPQSARKFPGNYILLAIFTIAEAVAVGFISAQYTQESVLMVLGVTVIVAFSLTLFACQTSVDFTGWRSYLFAALMTLVAFGGMLVLARFLGFGDGPSFQGLQLVYAGCGALLFSVYLVYDTQKMIGGKHKVKFGIDDYVYASINLYLDILNLFVFLLRIFGRRR